MRRSLSETLLDVLGAVQPRNEEGGMLHLASVYLDMPMEFAFRQGDGGLEFLADVPNWRWKTGFDEPRGRLRISCHEGEAG